MSDKELKNCKLVKLGLNKEQRKQRRANHDRKRLEAYFAYFDKLVEERNLQMQQHFKNAKNKSKNSNVPDAEMIDMSALMS